MNNTLVRTFEEITHNSSVSEEEQSHLTLQTLLSICVLIVYTISSSLFSTYDFHYLSGSGICMIIGLLVTLISMIISPEVNKILNKSSFAVELRFNQEVFFTFILPPIIFATAYTLQRKLFFKYLNYILIFSVLGTIINFFIVAFFNIITNYFQLFFSDEDVIDLSLTEIFLFAAAISASNNENAAAFIKEEIDPKLSSIFYGEGIVNDAICIVLYRIIKRFTDSEKDFMSYTPLIMTTQFIYLFIFSSLVGFIGGMLCALFLKIFKFINMSKIHEICVIIFFAFITYTFTHEISLSPIMSLLFAGIALSQYAYYNLSFPAREQSCIVANLMSNVAEAFVYTYLGLTFFYTVHKKFSLSFIILEFLFIVIARWVSIYSVGYLMRDFIKFRNFKMKNNDFSIMSFCGSIRGPISFGLAISMDTPNREIIISGTLVLIFFSTLFFGVLMPKFFSHMKANNEVCLDDLKPALKQTTKEFSHKFMNPNVHIETSNFKLETEEDKSNVISNKIAEFWSWLNECHIKPKLISDFPECIEEDEELLKGIKSVMEKKMGRRGSYEGIKLNSMLSLQTIEIDELPAGDNKKYVSKKGSFNGIEK